MRPLKIFLLVSILLVSIVSSARPRSGRPPRGSFGPHYMCTIENEVITCVKRYETLRGSISSKDENRLAVKGNKIIISRKNIETIIYKDGTTLDIEDLNTTLDPNGTGVHGGGNR